MEWRRVMSSRVIGNSLDFGARVYDSRLGRWLSVDALSKKFPSWSPYVFAFNNPIVYIDPDGNEPKDLNRMRAKARESKIGRELEKKQI